MKERRMKEGDKVIYVSEVNAIKWRGINPIDVPFCIDDKLTINNIIKQYGNEFLSLKEQPPNNYWPAECFKLYDNTKEIKYKYISHISEIIEDTGNALLFNNQEELDMYKQLFQLFKKTKLNNDILKYSNSDFRNPIVINYRIQDLSNGEVRYSFNACRIEGVNKDLEIINFKEDIIEYTEKYLKENNL